MSGISPDPQQQQLSESVLITKEGKISERKSNATDRLHTIAANSLTDSRETIEKMNVAVEKNQGFFKWFKDRSSITVKGIQYAENHQVRVNISSLMKSSDCGGWYRAWLYVKSFFGGAISLETIANHGKDADLLRLDKDHLDALRLVKNKKVNRVFSEVIRSQTDSTKFIDDKIAINRYEGKIVILKSLSLDWGGGSYGSVSSWENITQKVDAQKIYIFKRPKKRDSKTLDSIEYEAGINSVIRTHIKAKISSSADNKKEELTNALDALPGGVHLVSFNGEIGGLISHSAGLDLVEDKKFIRLHPADRLKAFLPLMCLLKTIHEAKIVHRDIKLDNICVDYDEGGTPKLTLIDFGLAAYFPENKEKQVSGYRVYNQAGTRDYMPRSQNALENLKYGNEDGDVGFSKHQDIYGLGVVLLMLFQDPDQLKDIAAEEGEILDTPSAKEALVYIQKQSPILENLIWTMLQESPFHPIDEDELIKKFEEAITELETSGRAASE